MSINERIKELRRVLNISQAQFAEDILISNGYIANIELGKRKVNERIIRLICVYYGVSEAWLKGGSGQIFEVDAESYSNTSRAMVLFKQLPPDKQDCALKQIKALLELHKEENSNTLA